MHRLPGAGTELDLPDPFVRSGHHIVTQRVQHPTVRKYRPESRRQDRGPTAQENRHILKFRIKSEKCRAMPHVFFQGL